MSASKQSLFDRIARCQRLLAAATLAVTNSNWRLCNDALDKLRTATALAIADADALATERDLESLSEKPVT